MHMEVIGIFCNQNAHHLKLHHPMYFINMPTVILVVKLNKFPSIYNWLTFGSKSFRIYYGYN